MNKPEKRAEGTERRSNKINIEKKHEQICDVTIIILGYDVC